MKVRLFIGKVIGFLGICLFSVGISYIITYSLEGSSHENIHLLATFEDTKEFSISTKVFSKEEILKTYPYIFTIENKGVGPVKYNLKIKINESSDIDQEDLEYLLFLNDKEVKSGNLADLEKNNLYLTNLSSLAMDTYKLYVYLTEEKEEVNCKYSLLVEAN